MPCPRCVVAGFPWKRRPDPSQAIRDGLKVARALAIWFETSFGKQGTAFKPGPFVPPEDPSTHLRHLQIEIDQLKAQLKSASQSLESSQHLADLVSQEKETYETLALQMDVEAKTYKELAFEQEAALKKAQQAFDAQLKALTSGPARREAGYSGKGQHAEGYEAVSAFGGPDAHSH